MSALTTKAGILQCSDSQMVATTMVNMRQKMVVVAMNISNMTNGRILASRYVAVMKSAMSFNTLQKLNSCISGPCLGGSGCWFI